MPRILSLSLNFQPSESGRKAGLSITRRRRGPTPTSQRVNRSSHVRRALVRYSTYDDDVSRAERKTSARHLTARELCEITLYTMYMTMHMTHETPTTVVSRHALGNTRASSPLPGRRSQCTLSRRARQTPSQNPQGTRRQRVAPGCSSAVGSAARASACRLNRRRSSPSRC